MRRRRPYPTLTDPREFITSVSFACGYTSDFGCASDQWANVVDPTQFNLVQNQASFQPSATVEPTVRAGALQFSDVAGDTMRCGPGSTPLVAGPDLRLSKSRYLRLIVRLDVYGGASRRIFTAGSCTIEMGDFAGEIRQSSVGLVKANAIDVGAVPGGFGSFRRIDAIWSVAAADTRLRSGSLSASGGSANTFDDPGATVAIGGSNQKPGVTVVAAWVCRGRPTDRELAAWDQCDAQRYGAGVLA